MIVEGVEESGGCSGEEDAGVMLVKLLRALLGKVAGGGTCGSLWRACFFGTQLAGWAVSM